VEYRFDNGEWGYGKLGTVTMVAAALFTQLAATTVRQNATGIWEPFVLYYQTKDGRIHEMVQTAPDNTQDTVRWESGIGLFEEATHGSPITVNSDRDVFSLSLWFVRALDNHLACYSAPSITENFVGNWSALRT